MDSEWRLYTLGDLTINFDGKRKPVKEADRVKGAYPYYGASGIVDYVDGYLFDGEYLLIAEDGENLRTRHTPIAFMARGKFWVNNHAHIVTGNELADTRFLMYALLNADVNSFLTGAVMPKLTQGNLNKIPIYCPSRELQLQIVDILGVLDDRINLLCETNATLEAIAQALFKSWFVDFDPVHAKAEGRPPEGIDSETATLFSDSFEETEFGLVPRGWRVGCISDFAQQKKGSVNPLASPDTIFEHYSLPAFDNGQSPMYEKGSEIKSNKTPLPQEVVLLSKLNPRIPRIWLPVRHGDNSVCSTEFLAFSPVGSSSKEYIYSFFCSPCFSQRLCQMVTGTSNSHQRVKPDQINAIHAVIPSDRVLTAFTEIVKNIFEKIFVNRNQVKILANLRNTLLPRLISGQLRLPDVAVGIKDIAR